MIFRNTTSIIFFLLLLFSACNNKKQAGDGGNIVDEYKIHYAKGFRVDRYAGYTQISVCDPWNSTRLLQTYILVDRSKELPAALPKGILIRTPLKTAVVFSAIHCTTLKELGNLDIVKGVCSPEYINIPEITDGVKNGTILNLGMSVNPDIEKIINLSPEVIFAEPVAGQTYGNTAKTKIPIIETPDYTEVDPLGRAEWIRFYSLFLGKEQLADSLFDITVKKYNEIKKITADVEYRPSILTDLRYMSKWNVPGGKGFMSQMIFDAGGLYKWADNNSTTFVPLPFESVLDKAGDADIWIIKNYTSTDMTYNSLEKEYKPYSYFKAFKERNIWGCNTNYSSYYEDLPIHPDRILKDYAAIFHPELFPEYQTRYYKRLE